MPTGTKVEGSQATAAPTETGTGTVMVGEATITVVGSVAQAVGLAGSTETEVIGETIAGKQAVVATEHLEHGHAMQSIPSPPLALNPRPGPSPCQRA